VAVTFVEIRSGSNSSSDNKNISVSDNSSGTGSIISSVNNFGGGSSKK
jgi:hypothetical protein